MGERGMRKTIYIPEDLQKRIEQESVLSGISQTELIRRAVAAYLETPEADRVNETAGYLDKEGADKQEKRRRLLGSLDGMIEDDELPEDLARGHDKYLYGGEA